MSAVKYSTDFFFDRQRVIDQMDRQEAKNLSKFGAFVRKTARQSIRKTKKAISKPGEPPRSHSPEPNIRTIFFAYDPMTHSVVVGSVRLNQRLGVLPEVLEKSGKLRVLEKRVGTRWIAGGRRRPRPGQLTRRRTYHIKARPFMQPALEKNVDQFPDLWAARA